MALLGGKPQERLFIAVTFITRAESAATEGPPSCDNDDKGCELLVYRPNGRAIRPAK